MLKLILVLSLSLWTKWSATDRLSANLLRPQLQLHRAIVGKLAIQATLADRKQCAICYPV